MKVILQKDVPHLGDAGEVKEVRSGYARNYLLPRRLAILAHAGTARALMHHKQMIERKRLKRQTVAQGLAEELSQLGSLDIPVRVGANEKMYGSITSHQISLALKEQGFNIDRRKLELEERIRTLGSHTIQVRLAENRTVPFRINAVAFEEPKSARSDSKSESRSESKSEAKLESRSEERQGDASSQEPPSPQVATELSDSTQAIAGSEKAVAEDRTEVGNDQSKGDSRDSYGDGGAVGASLDKGSDGDEGRDDDRGSRDADSKGASNANRDNASDASSS